MASAELSKFQQFFQVGGIDVMNSIDTMPKEEFDALPIGAILLDARARIVRYNRTEGELTNRDPGSVVGLNFFLDLAVCGVSDQFQGRFKEAAKALNYDAIFPYVFWYKMPETPMMVRMSKPRVQMQSPHVWVLVRRIMSPVPTH
jgi:photoactive yellow protein